ncbi:DUF4870 domain-containing protein [uncultured Limosilactobacillus sp.]|uniref:DUF4870 domain-containing protein n=1 Tax=uncultured Limosilactobacillus sp. TaxID=2837629 RepID=UPI0025CD0B35|nr:DUF4870 domain-containing protein [uncultured Limosilactobacillus sp.]
MKTESTTNRVLSCLSYLSILFLPVLFPLIVWIVDHQDHYVAHHARSAFWTQIFPALYVIVALLMFFILGATGVDQIRVNGGWLFGILTVFALLISLVLYIYNIAMGISVLIKRQ